MLQCVGPTTEEYYLYYGIPFAIFAVMGLLFTVIVVASQNAQRRNQLQLLKQKNTLDPTAQIYADK